MRDRVQRHYRGKQGERYHHQKRSIPEPAFPWIARARAQKFAKYVGAGDVVFEYGVGSGWNLALLRCKRRIGFDVSDLLGEAVEKHGIEFCDSMDAIGAGQFDVVICHHTLEHVLHPAESLIEIRRLLRPGGRLLLHVPFERERRYRVFKPDEPNHHLYSWNTQTLGNLVSESHFEVEEASVKKFGYDRFAAVWAHKLRLQEPGFRMIRGLFQVLKPVREVCIVARKPESAQAE